MSELIHAGAANLTADRVRQLMVANGYRYPDMGPDFAAAKRRAQVRESMAKIRRRKARNNPV